MPFDYQTKIHLSRVLSSFFLHFSLYNQLFLEWMSQEEIPILYIDESVAKKQLERLKEVKKMRNKALVKQCLSDLKKAAQDEENLMPYILKAVKAYATLGEIIDSLKEIYGEYQEPITY